MIRLLSSNIRKNIKSTRNFSIKPINNEQYKVCWNENHDPRQCKGYFINENYQLISPFHDIPLKADSEANTFNMIVEIPRFTNLKLEMNKDGFLNPIQPDIKKGKYRVVKPFFPYSGYLWNYGYLPQTWESPFEIHPALKVKGDNDPIDVCEIGSKLAKVGDVKQVKLLGGLAMLDEGELDWKVFAIDIKDPLAKTLNDIKDIETHLPDLIPHTINWFKNYKKADGKPENQFAFDSEPQSKEKIIDVVNETHGYWKKLLNSNDPSMETKISKNFSSDLSVAFKENEDFYNAHKILQGDPYLTQLMNTLNINSNNLELKPKSDELQLHYNK